MQVSSPQPLRSSLRRPHAPQPSPLAPYTPVPNSTRTTPRNAPRTPRFTNDPPPPEEPTPRRRNWLSREPATPRQRISNYFPAPTSPQPYPPFFPPQGYSPANSPWHTPSGRPIYVDGHAQGFSPPGQIAPIDSGLGVLSPPTVGPYFRPPRHSAISEEPSTRTSAPAPQQQFTPAPNPNYLVGSPPIPENLQPASHGNGLNLDPREGVLGPAGSAAGSSSSGVQSPPPTSRSFVGGFMSGIRRAFGGRRKEEQEGYIEPFMAQPNAYVPYPPLQQQQQYIPTNQHYSANTSTSHAEFPENESTIVGHHQQQQQGTISRDPLPLPVDTPFGSPSTVVTPFLLTRPISAASGGRGEPEPEGQVGDGSAADFFAPAPGSTHGDTSYAAPSYVPDPSSYAPQSTYTSYAPDPSSYPDPATFTQYPQPLVALTSPPADPQGYTSPPQAPDYLKMQSETTSVPLSTYYKRFKSFLKMINELPWVAERPTVDYYPGLNKNNEWGRRERRWTVSWTRKEGVDGEGRKSGRLTEIDLSSSSGSPPTSPQRGPNGISYPPQMQQPYWVTQALQMQQQPQLYYSYGNPMAGQGGGMIYPYSGGEGRAFAMVYPVLPVPMQQVLGPPIGLTPGQFQPQVQPQSQQGVQDGQQGEDQERYPAGYAPDHRPQHGDTMWGTPIHRANAQDLGLVGSGHQGEASAGMGTPRPAVVLN